MNFYKEFFNSFLPIKLFSLCVSFLPLIFLQYTGQLELLDNFQNIRSTILILTCLMLPGGINMILETEKKDNNLNFKLIFTVIITSFVVFLFFDIPLFLILYSVCFSAIFMFAAMIYNKNEKLGYFFEYNLMPIIFIMVFINIYFELDFKISLSLLVVLFIYLLFVFKPKISNKKISDEKKFVLGVFIIEILWSNLDVIIMNEKKLIYFGVYKLYFLVARQFNYFLIIYDSKLKNKFSNLVSDKEKNSLNNLFYEYSKKIQKLNLIILLVSIILFFIVRSFYEIPIFFLVLIIAFIIDGFFGNSQYFSFYKQKFSFQFYSSLLKFSTYIMFCLIFDNFTIISLGLLLSVVIKNVFLQILLYKKFNYTNLITKKI